ncbi:MAG: PepSY-associated TM helix domain-containing protein [Flavobacteriaceae bacterium]
MKISKKFFFKIHSWIGVKLSILFFIVCFSGTMATLSNEMDWLFNLEIRATPSDTLANKNDIIQNFKTIYPNAKITLWQRAEAPYMCDIIYKEENGKRSYVFANPYTGKIQGETTLTIQRFFRDLHYFLFMPQYQIGYFIVLAFAFFLLMSLTTALFIYKTWWKKFFSFQKGNSAIMVFRSLHRLIGLWVLPFVVLFSITGIWYFTERTNINNIGNKVNPDTPKVATANKTDVLVDTIDFSKIEKIAKNEIPGLKVGGITVPKNYASTLYLTGYNNVPLVRERANRVYINLNNYKVVKTQKAEDIGVLMWVNDIADPLHFGYWGGLPTKIIWFFAGCGISFLILSGIWITLKRQKLQQNKNKNKTQKAMGWWRYINWALSLIVVGFMYSSIVSRYGASLKAIFVISFGVVCFIGLGYYIFVFRINRSVAKTQK